MPEGVKAVADDISFDDEGNRIRTLICVTDDDEWFETRWIVSAEKVRNRRYNGGYPEHTVHAWDYKKMAEHYLAVRAWPLYRDRIRKLERMAGLGPANAALLDNIEREIRGEKA